MAASPLPSPISASPSKPKPFPLPQSLPRRPLLFLLHSTLAATAPLTLPPPPSLSAPAKKPFLGGIASTTSWDRFYGDGFSLRVPPLFDNLTEPDDPETGISLYGDRVKSKRFAARFASPDRSEVVSVIVRPSNQLKITFLEAQDIADLGSLKSAAGIFVPRGSTLYAARNIRIRDGEEDDDVRNYYYYEFGVDDQRVALVAAVSSGRAFVAASSAPPSRWEEDGPKLRSAAVSLSIS